MSLNIFAWWRIWHLNLYIYVKYPLPSLSELLLPAFTVSFEPLAPVGQLTPQNMHNDHVMEEGGSVTYVYTPPTIVSNMST